MFNLVFLVIIKLSLGSWVWTESLNRKFIIFVRENTVEKSLNNYEFKPIYETGYLLCVGSPHCFNSNHFSELLLEFPICSQNRCWSLQYKGKTWKDKVSRTFFGWREQKNMQKDNYWDITGETSGVLIMRHMSLYSFWSFCWNRDPVSLQDQEQALAEICLCFNLEALLLRKKSLGNRDSPELHDEKV